MEFYDLLKIKINELQFHIDRDSNMQLIIFDNPNLLNIRKSICELRLINFCSSSVNKSLFNTTFFNG